MSVKLPRDAHQCTLYCVGRGPSISHSRLICLSCRLHVGSSRKHTAAEKEKKKCQSVAAASGGSNTRDVHLSVKLSLDSRVRLPPPPPLSPSFSQSRPQRQRREASLTRTLCRPVRLGDSQSSWVSDTVSMQGFSPIRTV